MLALQHYRRQRGLSQQTLAKLANTTQPRISNIEHGHLKPSDKLLERLARVLGVCPAFTLLRQAVVEEQVAFEGENSRESA
ncbi:MAG TPA: helix-turn-helix transcriptional regulator [Vicinamibacterales bacterium]|nr:helix-turn-helix transcriptional regulator [Vicinamibacterales bacterium]